SARRLWASQVHSGRSGTILCWRTGAAESLSVDTVAYVNLLGGNCHRVAGLRHARLREAPGGSRTLLAGRRNRSYRINVMVAEACEKCRRSIFLLWVLPA
ncbi:MAG: hypothetical protein WCC41_07395, partial [Rhodomicrobium sp.]